MTRGARGRANVSGVRGREVVDGPRSREVLEGGRSRQVLLGPRGRNTGGLPAALREATLFLDAKYSVAGEPRVINRGTGGSALDAKYGSVLGAYVYDGAAVLPGINANSLSVPDEAALDITGDMEVVMRVNLADWTPGGISSLMGKRGGGIDAYAVQVTTAGEIRFARWVGAGVVVYTPPAPSLVNGRTYWIKFEFDLDNGSQSQATLYYAEDQPTEPSSWMTVGSATNVSRTATDATTAQLHFGVGGQYGNEPVTGSVRRAIIRDGIDGTTVLDVDLADVADYATSFTATTGQTVTVNSTSSDTNDPLLLTHTGDNWAHYGVASGLNALFYTHATAAPHTESVKITVLARLNGGRASFGEWTSTGDRRGIYLLVGSGANGRMRLQWTEDGIWDGGTRNMEHDVTTGKNLLDNQWRWYQAEMDIAADTVTFRYADYTGGDVPTVWDYESTPIATPVTVNQVFCTTASDYPTWGTENGANIVEGLNGQMFYRYEGDGSDTVEVDIRSDVTDAGATSFTATSGQTVTVNRATSGRKTTLVTRPVWLFGTDDYLEVADNDLLDMDASQDFTVMAVVRQFATPVSFGFVTFKDASTTGYFLQNRTTNQMKFQIEDGVNTAAASPSTYSLGTVNATFGVVDRTAEELVAYANTTPTSPVSTAAVGSLANSTVLRISSALGGQDMELVGYGVWRRALDADEIAAINTYYGTGA